MTFSKRLSHTQPGDPHSRLPWSLRVYRRRFATAAAAILAFGVGFHVVFGHNGLTAYRLKRQNAQSLQHQMMSLTQENDALRGHVQRLQTDPEAIEHQAREELHYARPGEVIFALPPEPLPLR